VCAAAPAWREVLAERAPRTSLNRPIGADRRLAIVRSRLAVAKQVAHAHQAKVNDVVLAAVAGGLRQLLASRGEDVAQLTLRVAVPVSLHHEQPGQASGNQDTIMVVPLLLGEPDPVRRLELIAAETAARKHRARPQRASGVMRFAAVQRASSRLLAHQRFLNLSVANVPGPPEPLYLAGARLLELFPVVAIMGNVTLGVGVLSYAGQLNFTAVADRDTCPTWRCSPRACAAPWMSWRGRCWRLPPEQGIGDAPGSNTTARTSTATAPAAPAHQVVVPPPAEQPGRSAHRPAGSCLCQSSAGGRA
jgi:diacylglycerol O-acyltransferase / wax synthase